MTNEKVMDAMKNISKAKQVDNAELGITQQYKRSLYDSDSSKKAYKNKVFGDRATYNDPISGKTLHKSQNAAQNKYHMKNENGENVSKKWAEHSAETDHVTALKDAHDKAKYNPFLSDSDFKEIMNSEDNYRIIPKSFNTSKGQESDLKIVFKKDSEITVEGKRQIIHDKIKSDITLHSKFAAKTAENMAHEFISGSADTLAQSAIPLTAEAVRHMVNVAQKKESMGEAAKEMGRITMDVAVVGGTNKLLVDAVTKQFLNSNNPALCSLANNNGVAQIITVAAIVKESAVKYVNGEIDGSQFIEEVGEKGMTMTAGMIGGAVGKEIGGWIGLVAGGAFGPGGMLVGYVAGEIVGEVLGAIITTIACGAIVSAYQISKTLDNYKEKEKRTRVLEREALKEMEKQRMVFKTIVQRENRRWDEQIIAGFDEMVSCACEATFNIQGVTEGLDKIMALFGKTVRFKTIEDYESQLSMPLKLKL